MALGSLIRWKTQKRSNRKPQVIRAGVSKRTFPANWSCTSCWRFLKQIARASRLCGGVSYRLPWTVTAGYAKSNLPAATTVLPAERELSVRNRHQAGRYSLRFLNKRPADIWISPLESSCFTCHHHSSFQWFVFLRQLNALFIVHFTPTTQLDPSWANLWLLLCPLYIGNAVHVFLDVLSL